MKRPQTVVVAALSAVAALAIGCDTTRKELPNLPLACETRQCVCTEAEILVLREIKEVPVEWRSTGEAYCPAGYVLRFAKNKT